MEQQGKKLQKNQTFKSLKLLLNDRETKGVVSVVKDLQGWRCRNESNWTGSEMLSN